MVAKFETFVTFVASLPSVRKQNTVQLVRPFPAVSFGATILRQLRWCLRSVLGVVTLNLSSIYLFNYKRQGSLNIF